MGGDAQADEEVRTRPAGPASPRKDAGAAIAAGFALVLMAAVFAVWAWQYGAWFEDALYPGTIVLSLGLIVVALFAPIRARLRGWTALAIIALVALAAWSALSALWSPSPAVAVGDAQRILSYAVAFVLGVWLCDLLRARRHLAMAPLAFAGLFAGCLTLGQLLGADRVGDVIQAGTLDYPIGYRNANAAFFLIAFWPAVGLAATRELAWPIRALSLGVATLCLQLGLLSQSRASIIAGGAALLVYVVASRDRARAVGWLLLATIPALIVIPALTDLYTTAGELGRERTLAEMEAAASAVALGAGVAVVVGACASLVGRAFPTSPTTSRRANRAVTVGAVALALAGAASFVVATGDPVEWLGDRADEFSTGGTPTGSDRSSRFAFNAGTERDDFWRVALDDAAENPLLGEGGGGFYYSYLRDRSEEGVESARDAHSVELEFLGELGAPGLLLFLIVLAAATVGALRSRHSRPGATALSAVALTAATYWLAHASIDWHWTFPALSAPVLALLGSACAGGVLAARSRARGKARPLVAAAGALLALSVIPPYLSQRYVSAAYDGWRADLNGAYEDLDRAAALNPLADEPLLAEGAIAREAGEPQRAIDAFERAAEKTPEEWVSYYFLALLYEGQDPQAARQELARAIERNPRSIVFEDGGPLGSASGGRP